jgi:flagellar biosynthesis/type III secretory pathway protein FliH
MDIKTHEVFYDKLTYLYIELEKFNKTETELVTMLDKWLFVLKNLSNLMSRPAQLQERVFTKLFEAAEIAKFDSNELRSYEQSINAYRDIKNSLDTASKEGFTKGKIEGKAEGFVEGMEKGMEKGKAEGRADTAKKMKIKGLDLNLISDITGLSIEEIKRL